MKEEKRVLSKKEKRIALSKSAIQAAVDRGDGTLNLTNLNLKSDDLRELIPIIKEKLPSLKVLSLNNNDLDSLSDEIGDLSSLEYLDVSNNKVKTLPLSFFDKLTRLKGLKLFNNEFEDLPNSGKKEHPSLERIELSRNPLSSLSLGNLFGICGDKRMKKIYLLEQSKIKGIKQTLTDLHKEYQKFRLAKKVAKFNPEISLKDFYEFVKGLNSEQIGDINSDKLFYSVDSEGKLKLSTENPLDGVEKLSALTEVQISPERSRRDFNYSRSFSGSQFSDSYLSDGPLEEKKSSFKTSEARKSQQDVPRRKIFKGF